MHDRVLWQKGYVIAFIPIDYTYSKFWWQFSRVIPWDLQTKRVWLWSAIETFYHGCNILTNQIAQKEIDKSHINLKIINLQDIYQLWNGARVLSGQSNWMPDQHIFYSCVASSLFARRIVIMFSQISLQHIWQRTWLFHCQWDSRSPEKRKRFQSSPFAAVTTGLDHTSRAWIAFIPVQHSSSILVEILVPWMEKQIATWLLQLWQRLKFTMVEVSYAHRLW